MIVRRHRRGFTPAGEISIGRLELPSRLKGALRLQRAWTHVADAELVEQTTALRLSRGTLTIQLAAGADSTELEPAIQRAVAALGRLDEFTVRRYKL